MTLSPLSPSSSPQRAYPTKPRKEQPGMAPIHVPAPSKLCPVFSTETQAPPRTGRAWISL
ncbi:hypothetical protein GCM10023185_26460 [Hymenobacter saemangeumensis]|uniref:Uncharacterized protein n=1 Tax=Hymenobacter saemangeumensis TaxID=1084522 RepID=A0ABP8IIW7_9BACT